MRLKREDQKEYKMVTQISDKTIYKQLSGNYTLGIILLAVTAAGCGAGGFFCGKELGWTNLIAIILLIALVICLVLIVILAIKAAGIRKHPVFRKYGSAAELAERINAGLRDPRYIARSLDGSQSLVTLIGGDFIVSGLDYVSFTELRDIRKIQATFIPKTFIVAVGNPAATAASLAMQHAGDRYWESRGLNENTRIDYLIVTDADGKTKRFGVHHQDMEQVLTLLYQANPQVQIDTTAYRM